MSEKQKVSEAFKAAVLGFVQSQTLRDESFARRVELPEKSVEECCLYILSEVRKSGRMGFHDDEIFGMVVHYYIEDDVQVCDAPECCVVVNTEVELTEEEKAEARRQAIEQYRAEELAKLRAAGRSAKGEKNEEFVQHSLFD